MLGYEFEPPAKILRRYGLALMLGLIVLLILGTAVWERSYVGVMKKSCASMYDDRLMPAATLFRLSDQIHARRLVLEEHLAGYGDQNVNRVHYELGRLDGEIDASIAQIEKTYLVEDESRLLHELEAQLVQYGQLEERVLADLAKGHEVTYDGPIRKAFEDLRQELIGLTAIQEKVGKDLNHESFTAAASVSLLTYFQLSAGFVLGLLASALALNLGIRRVRTEVEEQAANDSGSS